MASIMGHMARLGALGALLLGCTAIVDADIAPSGIGGTCKSSSDCQAGTCNEEGLCVATCSANADCPDTTQCLGGVCQKPLKVGALWVGVAAGGEGWTLTHDEGMRYAQEKLSYLSWSKKENVVSNDQINAAIDEFVADGSNVIIANSFSQREAVMEKAKSYPNVKFLTAQAYISNNTNADSFAAHGEQGWWIAGKVAGTKTIGSKTHRLGYVGALVTPELVRHISAFFLGARSVDPAVTLEVQWIGFWSDTSPAPKFEYKDKTTGASIPYFYEQLLTRRLIDHGAVVIAHGADNQRVVKLIDDLKIPGVWSISNDNANAYKALAPQPSGDVLPTGAPLATCLGSPYWNWGPLYVDMFQKIHAGTWNPSESRNEPMTSDSALSPVGFNLNPVVGVDDPAVRGFITDIALRGWQAIYAGPYRTTGQRDKDGDGTIDLDQQVAAGDTLTESEYSRMCWFPEGVVERFPADSEDPASERPARVPDAAYQNDPATKAKRDEMTYANFPGISFDCSVNK